MDRKLATFWVSPAEYDVLNQLAGRNRSAYLRKLVAQDAKARGVEWPDELHDTRGKHERATPPRP